MSVNIVSSSSLPLLAKTIMHPAAWSLCDSWASFLVCCVHCCSETAFSPVRRRRRPARTIFAYIGHASECCTTLSLTVSYSHTQKKLWSSVSSILRHRLNVNALLGSTVSLLSRFSLDFMRPPLCGTSLHFTSLFRSFRPIPSIGWGWRPCSAVSLR